MVLAVREASGWARPRCSRPYGRPSGPDSPCCIRRCSYRSSRAPSYSSSFQPTRYSSTSTCGLWASLRYPLDELRFVHNNPEPNPRARSHAHHGVADCFAKRTASSRVCAAALRGTSTPISPRRVVRAPGPRSPRWCGSAYRGPPRHSARARPAWRGPGRSSGRLPAEADGDPSEAARARSPGRRTPASPAGNSPIGKALRSLDGGDVGIHEHRGDALVLQRPDRLAAGIVELPASPIFRAPLPRREPA